MVPSDHSIAAVRIEQSRPRLRWHAEAVTDHNGGPFPPLVQPSSSVPSALVKLNVVYIPFSVAGEVVWLDHPALM